MLEESVHSRHDSLLSTFLKFSWVVLCILISGWLLGVTTYVKNGPPLEEELLKRLDQMLPTERSEYVLDHPEKFAAVTAKVTCFSIPKILLGGLIGGSLGLFCLSMLGRTSSRLRHCLFNHNRNQTNERPSIGVLVKIGLIHVAILMAAILVSATYLRNRSRRVVLEDRGMMCSRMQAVTISVQAFHREYGQWPQTLSELMQTNNAKRIRFVPRGYVRDVWRTPLRYIPPCGTGTGSIVSFGPDRAEGGHGLGADLMIPVNIDLTRWRWTH